MATSLPLQTPAVLKDLHKRPNIHIAQAGSVVFAKFGATTVHDLDVLLSQQLLVATEHKGHMTMISLVEVTSEVGRIGDDVTKKSVESMNAIAKVCRGSGTVVIARGCQRA